MKKLVFLSALLSLSLIGCSSDDEKPIDDNTSDPQNLLVGQWNMVKGEVYQNGDLLFSEDLKLESCDYDYYNFKPDGIKDEVYHDDLDDCSTTNWTGTWSYNEQNDQITLIDDDDNYTLVLEVISVTTTDLKLKLVSDDGENIPEEIEVYQYLTK